MSDEEIAAIKKALEEMAEHNKKDLSDFKKYLKIFYEFFTRFGGTGKEENQILWKAVKSLDFTVFCEKKIIAFLVISYYNKIQRL